MGFAALQQAASMGGLEIYNDSAFKNGAEASENRLFDFEIVPNESHAVAS
jgi:hypothetical protein